MRSTDSWANEEQFAWFRRPRLEGYLQLILWSKLIQVNRHYFGTLEGKVEDSVHTEACKLSILTVLVWSRGSWIDCGMEILPYFPLDLGLTHVCYRLCYITSQILQSLLHRTMHGHFAGNPGVINPRKFCAWGWKAAARSLKPLAKGRSNRVFGPNGALRPFSADTFRPASSLNSGAQLSHQRQRKEIPTCQAFLPCSARYFCLESQQNQRSGLSTTLNIHRRRLKLRYRCYCFSIIRDPLGRKCLISGFAYF